MALAPPGPLAIGIEAQAASAEALHGQVQQGVGRSAVPAQHRGLPVRPAGGRQQGEVGDSPQIQQGAPAADGGQQGRIRRRHQGRPLAPEGQVGGAKVEDHRSLQQRCQQGALQQLPAAATAFAAGGAMPQGLAMAAHQVGPALGITAMSRGGLHFGEGLPQFDHLGGADRPALARGDQPCPQVGWIGRGSTGQQAPAGPLRWPLEVGQHRVDAIGTCAAHQPQHPHHDPPTWAGYRGSGHGGQWPSKSPLACGQGAGQEPPELTCWAGESCAGRA